MDSEQSNNFLKLDKRVELQTEEESTPNNVGLSPSRTLLEECNSIEKLKALISHNLLGCDLTVCIFIAALKSFMPDQCLRPFPQCFINENNEKDFASVKMVCDKIPPLKDLWRLPASNIPKDVADLLTWLFMESGIPTLQHHNKKTLPLTILNRNAVNNALPSYVFEVSYNKKFKEAWEKRIGHRDIFYAFHGSHVSNFHSILKFGLHQHLGKRKEVLYGNGIYLSNEISVCTNFAPFGETWKNSILGHRHSIIAVCEVIDHEDYVKCKDEKDKNRALNETRDRIPEKYFVVRNSELVQIKYLLVYVNNTSSAVKALMKRHLVWFLIVSYFILLVFVGFINGPSWPKFIRYVNSLVK